MNERNLDKDIMALRHSAAHLLGHAVSELYPNALLTIGPATKEGFFYDFLPERTFKEEDLAPIAERMRKLADKNIPLTHEQISKEEARKLYAHNPFKLELINDIPGETVGLARQGDFYDLCRGGHVSTTGLLKNFKLTSPSGSYWRADREKQALQRISGIVFFSAEDLAAHEKRQEEAELYDHRRLGKQLDLFSFHEEGVGFPFFHQKGKRVLTVLVDYMRKLQREFDYEEIETPTMLSDTLWRQSGHYTFYKDNMYFSNIDEASYAIKPMNCPGSILIYKNKPRSYRELPLKLAEYGHVHRHELSGVLHGLMRVRAFTQDDSHTYCMPEQIEEVIIQGLKLAQRMLKKFEFQNVTYAISTKPEKALGSEEFWKKATDALIGALNKTNTPYTIKPGEGAFYGPKIEITIEDSMKRKWQCGTIQVDPFMPENFDLSYVASHGGKERPIIIHQATFGSLERFFAIALEHFKGALPFWLAPVQARIMPITNDHNEYAQNLYNVLKKEQVRVELDASGDPLAAQIKNAQQEKIPWMIIVGKKEIESNTVTLRYLDGKQEFGISHTELLSRIKVLNS